LLRPLVPVVLWATLWPEGLAAPVSGAAPARPDRGPLPAPCAMHPVRRIAIAQSSAPTRFDGAQICEVIVAALQGQLS